jgi:NAD(P)-dependent dehydrogenase (short-subunit alcohol dehydrogenase family)
MFCWMACSFVFQGLSSELIEKGIRVNCVAPGPVWTPLVTASFPTDKLKVFGEQCPTKRPAQPCELAHAYVFLASDQASFVNGEVLGVTGGGILG